MSRPVIAYHIILTFYGFWLPNDQRGSGTDTVWSEDLRPFGNGTRSLADGERSVSKRPFDREAARAAKRALQYPAVRLAGKQALVVAKAVGELAGRDALLLHAFSIMPDHLHFVALRHARRTANQMMTRTKSAATRALVEQAMHPLARFAKPGKLPPKLFARGGQHRFLFEPRQVRDRIVYVEQNPVKAGLPPQRWSFVKPYRDQALPTLSRERSERYKFL